jgi:NAD dependent epimerase/dehydratase family enzyme
MPSWLLRALFGRMAEETLLADLNVQPSCLEALGFQWTTPTVKVALTSILESV